VRAGRAKKWCLLQASSEESLLCPVVLEHLLPIDGENAALERQAVGDYGMPTKDHGRRLLLDALLTIS